MSTRTAEAKRSERPPGPRQHWLAGNLREFARDRLGHSRRHRQYGDIVQARFGPRSIIFLHHPDLVEDVLVSQNRKFIKHYRLRSTRRTLGSGLLTSEGEFWRTQRRLAQPAFHRERIASYAEMMVDSTLRMLEGWQDGQSRDVQADMMRLTLEIVARTLFAAEIGSDTAGASAAMETLLHTSMNRMGQLIPIPHWVPTLSNLRVECAARRLDAIILAIIAARRRSGEDRGDLLSMLLHAQDEEAAPG